MKNTITCVIFTKDEKENVVRLLNQISTQSLKFQEILVIENVNNKVNFNFEILKSLINLNKIRLTYKSVLFKNVAQSRNLALSLINTDHAIFMDNDIQIRPNYLSLVKKHLVKKDKNWAVVGQVLASDNSVLNRYGAMFMPQGSLKTKKTMTVNYSGMASVGLKMSEIKKSKIKFDSSLDTGEDVDFYLKIKRAGGSLLYDPRIKIKHDFTKKNIFNFVYRYYQYSLNFLKIQQKNNDYYDNYKDSSYFPQRKIHWVILPFYVIYRAVNEIESNLKIEMSAVSFLVHLAIIIGLYNSTIGRKILLDKFYNNWNIKY